MEAFRKDFSAKKENPKKWLQRKKSQTRLYSSSSQQVIIARTNVLLTYNLQKTYRNKMTKRTVKKW
jgi:hypothetical protein